MKDNQNTSCDSLKGSLLIAMPNIDDLRFNKSVIYIYEHSKSQGAKGIVLNHPADKVSFGDILDQLKIPHSPLSYQPAIVLGGPEEVAHGFILHSDDYHKEETKYVANRICITETQDILEDIVLGSGPEKSLISLGCATWSKGQLEEEILQNVWLTAPATQSILFNTPFHARWAEALKLLGINPLFLSDLPGRA